MNPSEWFSEISNELWPGQCFSVKVKQVLHEERSKYQDIKIIQRYVCMWTRVPRCLSFLQKHVRF